MVQDTIPSTTATYRHMETADQVKFLYRDGVQYIFRINDAWTKELDVSAWPTYRDYLVRD